MRIKELLKSGFEIPLRARNAAEKIQTERAVLRKRMTRKVRLREKAKPGDPAGARKFMPKSFPDDVAKVAPNVEEPTPVFRYLPDTK